MPVLAGACQLGTAWSGLWLIHHQQESEVEGSFLRTRATRASAHARTPRAQQKIHGRVFCFFLSDSNKGIALSTNIAYSNHVRARAPSAWTVSDTPGSAPAQPGEQRFSGALAASASTGGRGAQDAWPRPPISGLLGARYSTHRRRRCARWPASPRFLITAVHPGPRRERSRRWSRRPTTRRARVVVVGFCARSKTAHEHGCQSMQSSQNM